MVISVSVMAQSRKFKPPSPPFTHDHEVRLGYNPLSVLFLFVGNHGVRTPGNYTSGKTQDLGTFSLMYTYKLYRKLEIGAALVYSGKYTGRYQDFKKVGAYNRTFVSIEPTVRFAWLNHRSIRLYSSASFGMGLLITKDNTDIVKYEEVSSELAGQITPFGIVVGRRLFFFLEPYTFGTQGIFAVTGFGYRFLGKEKSNEVNYF